MSRSYGSGAMTPCEESGAGLSDRLRATAVRDGCVVAIRVMSSSRL